MKEVESTRFKHTSLNLRHLERNHDISICCWLPYVCQVFQFNASSHTYTLIKQIKNIDTVSTLTVNLLDSHQIVHGQLEVVRVHILVERRHDGCGIVGVLQAQCVAELVDSHQEQIVTWEQRDEEGVSRAEGAATVFSAAFGCCSQ